LNVIDQPTSDFWGWFWFIGLYTVPFVFLYGVPVSILSDKLSAFFTRLFRPIMALVIHVVFGIVISFVIYFFQDLTFSEYWIQWGELMFIASSLAAIIFWLVDELLRKFVDWDRVQSAL